MKINSIRAFSVALLASVIVFQSCKDKDNVKGAYQSGVLVANEGQFGSSNGDVTYYNPSSAIVDQNIYKTVNGSFSGNVLQSIFLDGSTGYLVVNDDNKIEIVDDNTFELQHTFSDARMINPRYLQVINGKAYISCWGAFNSDFVLTNSSVVVVDLSTLAIVTTIPTDIGIENLLYNGQYLFVSNTLYGGTNVVTVIDPSTNTIVTKINLRDGPSGMALDVNNKLWVVTIGSDAALYRINPSTFVKEDSVSIGASAGNDLGITPDKKTLVYTVGNSVYELPIGLSTAQTTPLLNASNISSLYSMGVDPQTGDIYLGDALSFSSSGEVYVYDAGGTVKTSFVAGIAPGQFIFR